MLKALVGVIPFIVTGLLCARIDVESNGPDRASSTRVPLPTKDSFHEIAQSKHLLRAIEDFRHDKNAAVPYYVHAREKTLAINAAKPELRNRFARATYTFAGPKTEIFDLVLVTLTETDGECDYRVWLNDRQIGTFKNPETKVDYQEAYFRIKGVEIRPGDVIAVESNAVTNGKIPEGDSTAFARGRWRGLVLQ